MIKVFYNDKKRAGTSQVNKLGKRIIHIGLLLVISVVVVACSRPGDNSTGESAIVSGSTEGKGSKAELTPTEVLEPTPTEGPGSAAASEQTKEPKPTAAPTLTERPGSTAALTLTEKPEPTATPTPTKESGSTAAPAPTRKPDVILEQSSMSDFVPSKEIFHSSTAFVYGDYLFFKAGELMKPAITAQNLKTSKRTEITSIEGSYFKTEEFYLKGSDIYYHEMGDIYRIGVNGKNKTRLYKGTATILGFHGNDIIALERKTREIIRINKGGEKTSLAKMDSIDSLEAVMVQDGVYYISKKSNNTFDRNDPLDCMYYIDFDGRNKTKVCEALDIYDLKINEDAVFFMTFSEEPGMVEIKKLKDHKATTLHSISKEEFEAQGNWFDNHNFTLLAVNSSRVFYGINLDDIYSVGMDGKDYGLYLKATDIEGIHPDAYFSTGDIEGDYLKIVFDCDEAPVEIYLINIRDQSSIKFDGAYYVPNSIDVEGEYVYYLKSSQFDPYGDSPKAYQYGRSKLLKYIKVQEI